MFKLATLAAIGLVAADTTETEQKYEKEGKKKLAALKKSAVTGSSKVAKHLPDWEIPGHLMGGVRKVPSYKEVVADPETYCMQCVWSGGAYTAPGLGSHPAAAACDYSDAADKTSDTKVALDATLDFKNAFVGMSVCANELDTSSDQWVIGSQSVKGAEFVKSADSTCLSSWDLTDFIAHADKGKSPTPNSWKYTFNKQATDTDGNWCYFQTHLPASYSGGLIMTQTEDKDVSYVLRVDLNVERYFTKKTTHAMSIGKTGKVPLTGASKIDVMYQQKSSMESGTTNNFDLTFTRASYLNMTKLVAEHGGAVVWIIIGCVVCCLIITLACLFKCYKQRQEDKNDSGDNQFYGDDDLYARV